MPYFRSGLAQWGRGLFGALCMSAMALHAGTAAADGEFELRETHTRLVDGVYFVNASFLFDFSDEALEALDNGVALTVRIDMRVLRARRLLWDERVAALSARRRLRLHPLSALYVLENLNTGAKRTFRNLDEALSALTTVADFPMLDAHLLAGDERYSVQLRARLDIEALPAPLRPLAYLSSLWRLGSDWYTRPLTP